MVSISRTREELQLYNLVYNPKPHLQMHLLAETVSFLCDENGFLKDGVKNYLIWDQWRLFTRQ